jgi:hypothetical protein
LGSRRIVDALAEAGIVVNCKKVQRLVRLTGLADLYPKPRNTIPTAGNRIYPYLLRGLTIERPNQVWCADVKCRRRHLKSYADPRNMPRVGIRLHLMGESDIVPTREGEPAGVTEISPIRAQSGR